MPMLRGKNKSSASAPAWREKLAEALATTCDVGGEVPAALYDSVAETLAFVREVRRMKPARAAVDAA